MAGRGRGVEEGDAQWVGGWGEGGGREAFNIYTYWRMLPEKGGGDVYTTSLPRV